MRKRETIEVQARTYVMLSKRDMLQLEVLLDIRDLLSDIHAWACSSGTMLEEVRDALKAKDSPSLAEVNERMRKL